MNIKKLFLKLTSQTYPHGYEHLLEPFLPKGYEKDKFGNYFIKIGNSESMFTCHLDTASHEAKPIKHVIDKNIIRTDKTTLLGADDKAGVVILLSMIENKTPGLYYFFLGEEVGCVGSGQASGLDFSSYKRCISFDRRGYSSVITHQLYGRCCSEKFAQSLSEQLNASGLSFRPDSTGVMTDSASFMNDIPECTNISVGYFNEHTVNETQDISFLYRLAKAVSIVDWEGLPTDRNPEEENYSSYFKKSNIRVYEPTKSHEVINKQLSAVIRVYIDNQLFSAHIKPERIVKERGYIYSWIFKQSGYRNFQGIDWDGKSCYVNFERSREYVGERSELIHVIDNLSEIPVEDLIILQKLS